MPRLLLMSLKATAAEQGPMRINGSGSSPSGVSRLQKKTKQKTTLLREMEVTRVFNKEQTAGFVF